MAVWWAFGCSLILSIPTDFMGSFFFTQQRMLYSFSCRNRWCFTALILYFPYDETQKQMNGKIKNKLATLHPRSNGLIWSLCAKQWKDMNDTPLNSKSVLDCWCVCAGLLVCLKNGMICPHYYSSVFFLSVSLVSSSIIVSPVRPRSLEAATFVR